MLYHVAGFVPDNNNTVYLKPGTQNSCGVGVYFTEGFPQLQYAGGERSQFQWFEEFVIVFAISTEMAKDLGFFRSKNKPGRPRFWHSNGQTIAFSPQYTEEVIEGKCCRVYSITIKEGE